MQKRGAMVAKRGENERETNECGGARAAVYESQRGRDFAGRGRTWEPQAA